MIRKLEPFFDIDGRFETADGGAISRERKQIFICECGEYVVWCKSKRTGNSYLANCSRYMNNPDRLWYAPNSPHFKSCKAEQSINKGKEETSC